MLHELKKVFLNMQRRLHGTIGPEKKFELKLQILDIRGRTVAIGNARRWQKICGKVEVYSRRVTAKLNRPFRHLSPSIAPKRNFLTVDLTVTPAYRKQISRYFRYL